MIAGRALERALPRHPLAERWLARPAAEDQVAGDGVIGMRPAQLLYRLPAHLGRGGNPAALDHPHILRADALAPHQPHVGSWLASRFPGVHGRLFPLADVARRRPGGSFPVAEAVEVARHLLDAARHAHAMGVAHGPIDPSGVLVDPRGRALVELYAMSPGARERDADLDEVRSIASLTLRLVDPDATAQRPKGLHAALLRWSEDVHDTDAPAGEAFEMLQTIA